MYPSALTRTSQPQPRAMRACLHNARNIRRRPGVAAVFSAPRAPSARGRRAQLGPLAAAAAQGTATEIELLDQTNYYDKIASAGTPVVVIDFYTDWCGPCKLIYPKLVAKQEELKGQVKFYKFKCNKANKDLGVKLGVRVAPTFFVYKGTEHVSTVSGAKMDKLNEEIAAALA